MKFRFTMQAVLDHREHLQREAELALGREMQGVATLERQLQELTQEYFKLTETRGGVDWRQGERMMDYIWYSEQLKVRIAKKKQDISEQQKKVEAARRLLVQRTQDKRAIEIVRDSQRQAHQLAEKRAQEKRTDESAQTRFIRSEKEFQ